MSSIFKNKSIRVKKYEIKIGKDGEEYYKETEAWKKIKHEKNLKALVKESNLPSYAIELNLDNYIGTDIEKIAKLKTYIANFKQKYNSIHLYFWSHENSTQKTTTASVVGKLLLEKGFSVQFILMNRLIKLLSEEKFNNDLTFELDKCRNCDFLIIDDCYDKKKATIYKSGYQIPFLDEFLRTRLEIKKKATCFSSNFQISEIDEDVFGSSMKNLMKRTILDPFHFGSSYQIRNNFNIKDLWS